MASDLNSVTSMTYVHMCSGFKCLYHSLDEERKKEEENLQLIDLLPQVKMHVRRTGNERRYHPEVAELAGAAGTADPVDYK